MDTRSKRASSVNLLKPYAAALVLPDGDIDAGDRKHSAWDYAGELTAPLFLLMSADLSGSTAGATLGGSKASVTITGRRS